VSHFLAAYRSTGKSQTDAGSVIKNAVDTDGLAGGGVKPNIAGCLADKVVIDFDLPGNSKIVVNAVNGNVTVKKKLKKGTYKVNVEIIAAGDATTSSSAPQIVTITIKVK